MAGELDVACEPSLSFSQDLTKVPAHGGLDSWPKVERQAPEPLDVPWHHDNPAPLSRGWPVRARCCLRWSTQEHLYLGASHGLLVSVSLCPGLQSQPRSPKPKRNQVLRKTYDSKVRN